MNLFGHLVGLLGREISSTQCLNLRRTTQHRKTQTHIHASSGIRTHDPSVRAVEVCTCLRPCGHWDRLNIIIKVKLSLCLTKHHAMKTYWGSGYIAPRILDLGLDGGELSASRSGRFTSRERAPCTHCIGG
jgi:hypothetical protein